MLWVKAFHIIFIVCWFAGLFYLPRLFVYHADCADIEGQARFKLMEKKLYYAITLPAGFLTTGFGLWMLTAYWSLYSVQTWMQLKLFAVLLLWAYTAYCGCLVNRFSRDKNTHTARWYRFFNEVPSIFLMAIVILTIVRPF